MKESLQLRLWNLNICIEKVDAKCCLAEMTLVMISLSMARAFQCLFIFVLVSFNRISGNLAAQLTGSHRGIGEIPETQLHALLPFPVPPPERK